MLMTLPSSRRKENLTERRSTILQAARAVFAQQGYAQTVVDDIAAKAGIGKGTLYLYFPSKEQIYMEALLEDARQLDKLSREAMDAAEHWQTKLRAYLTVRLQYLETNQDFLRIYVTEFRGMCLRGKPLEAELYQLIQEGQAQLAQMFAAAAARGEIRQVNPELAAITVSDLTRGLLERRLLGRGTSNGSADAEFALDVLCRALESR